MVRVTALMDNQPSENKMLIHEHGLSLLVEGEGMRILFDCGGSGSFLKNAHRLGLRLDHLDCVALSHSHYDHAAGYRDLIEAGLGSELLYTGPHFFEKKFAFDGVRYTDLSAGFDPDFLQAHGIRHIAVDGMTQIAPGVFLVNGFPRKYAFETIPSRFIRQDGEHFLPDDFADEQCLVLERKGKLYLFVGCSHPGILNMVTHIHTLLGKPVAAVFGGTHLVEADSDRIAQTLCTLQEIGLETIGLSHCSGEAAEQIAADHRIATCHLSCGSCIFLE